MGTAQFSFKDLFCSLWSWNRTSKTSVCWAHNGSLLTV